MAVKNTSLKSADAVILNSDLELYDGKHYTVEVINGNKKLEQHHKYLDKTYNYYNSILSVGDYIRLHTTDTSTVWVYKNSIKSIHYKPADGGLEFYIKLTGYDLDYCVFLAPNLKTIFNLLKQYNLSYKHDRDSKTIIIGKV